MARKWRKALGVMLLGSITIGCQHQLSQKLVDHIALGEGDREPLRVWLDYNAQLKKMNARDLKNEAEHLRRSIERAPAWEGELRLALVQTAQHIEDRSFQKATEPLQNHLDNGRYNSEMRLWLQQYKQQLELHAQLEKELQEEKKQRGELEAKLKALSDIELEMSQREKNE